MQTVGESVDLPAYLLQHNSLFDSNYRYDGRKQPPLRLVNLLPVVGNRAVQRTSYTDFCDHFASISLESSTIRRLSFTSSTVCCSNL